MKQKRDSGRFYKLIFLSLGEEAKSDGDTEQKVRRSSALLVKQQNNSVFKGGEEGRGGERKGREIKVIS